MKLAVLISLVAVSLAHATPIQRGTATTGGEIQFDGVYYDYRDAEGRKGIKLWVPPGEAPVRGVLFHGNPGGTGGDTRNLAADPRLQEFAARHRFGIIGVTWFQGRRVYDEFAAVVFHVLDDWAKLGQHPELANVPLIPRGSSNAGITAYSLTCYRPKRILCFTPNVGPRYFPARPPAAALRVPGLLHIGPHDQFFPLGLKDTAELFVDCRDTLWAWDAEQNKKHEIGHIDDIDLKFYETCIALRLPANANPRKGPIKLRNLRREEGWLADTGTWFEPAVIAPYAEFTGDKSRACWLPTKDIAYLYRGIASYNNPLTLSLRDLSAVKNPDASGALLRSAGGNVVDPGTRVTLECEVAKDFDWERIEFYSGGSKIGEVQRGQPARCELLVCRQPTVYAFTAVGHDKNGRAGTAAPVHFIVRDPVVSAALAEQRRQHDAPIPDGPGVVIPVSTDTGGAVLLAPGLTAQQAQRGNFWGNQPGMLVGTQMTVQAAHSPAGLHLLFEANAEVQAVDFHIARESAAALWIGQPMVSKFDAIQYSHPLTESQYQADFGGTELTRMFPDPFSMFLPRRQTFDQAREQYGIIVRQLAGRRAMEWFIPWAYVGKPGPMQEPPVGARLALVLGFNSKTSNPRWPNGADPWTHPCEKGPNPNPWGDLEIGAISNPAGSFSGGRK